jgi:hypothetical protein
MKCNVPEPFKIYISRAIISQKTREHNKIISDDIIAESFDAFGHPVSLLPKSDVPFFISPWLRPKRAVVLMEHDRHSDTPFSREGTSVIENILLQSLVESRGLMMRHEDNFTTGIVDFVPKLGSSNTVLLRDSLQQVTL